LNKTKFNWSFSTKLIIWSKTNSLKTRSIWWICSTYKQQFTDHIYWKTETNLMVFPTQFYIIVRFKILKLKRYCLIFNRSLFLLKDLHLIQFKYLFKRNRSMSGNVWLIFWNKMLTILKNRISSYFIDRITPRQPAQKNIRWNLKSCFHNSL
jgi:hypothetical protein